jgi:hypothetical protein
VIGRARHLHDDSLFEAYRAELEGTVLEPFAATHLSTCHNCARRLRELAAFMDDLRVGGDQDVDEIFTPERLRVQQQQIAHRLEHLGQVARVLSFPARVMGHRMTRTALRIAPRWAIAAAAAGLLVGVAMGTVMDPVGRHTPTAPAALPIAFQLEPAQNEPTEVDPPFEADDEAFLTELETALSGPRNEELMPFDELTPRVQPISQLR